MHVNIAIFVEAGVWEVNVTIFGQSRFDTCWEFIYKLMLIESLKLTESFPFIGCINKSGDWVRINIRHYMSQKISCHIICVQIVAPRALGTKDGRNLMAKFRLLNKLYVRVVIVIKSFLSLLFFLNDNIIKKS